MLERGQDILLVEVDSRIRITQIVGGEYFRRKLVADAFNEAEEKAFAPEVIKHAFSEVCFWRLGSQSSSCAAQRRTAPLLVM